MQTFFVPPSTYSILPGDKRKLRPRRLANGYSIRLSEFQVRVISSRALPNECMEAAIHRLAMESHNATISPV